MLPLCASLKAFLVLRLTPGSRGALPGLPGVLALRALLGIPAGQDRSGFSNSGRHTPARLFAYAPGPYAYQNRFTFIPGGAQSRSLPCEPSVRFATVRWSSVIPLRLSEPLQDPTLSVQPLGVCAYEGLFLVSAVCGLFRGYISGYLLNCSLVASYGLGVRRF